MTDEKGSPVIAHLGVSIYDKGYNDPTNSVDIESYCYLTSQLRGKIYDPLYYFDENNKERKSALDLLLLTQGWRRYSWNINEFQYDGEPFLRDEITGVQIAGSKKKNAASDPSEQFILVSGPEGNSELILTDSVGRFAIDPDLMNELRGGYVYLKPMSAKESKPGLTIYNYFPMLDSISKNRNRYYPYTNYEAGLDEQRYMPYLFSKDSTILLDEITVTGKSRRLYRDKFMGAAG
ncbi:MAG: hypothetical protein LUH15_19955 [Tannerellaceae bacterium]|nr:hypothetical protein [Tannerellaceae bacterium]